MRVTAVTCDVCKQADTESRQYMLIKNFVMYDYKNLGVFDICPVCTSRFERKEIVFDLLARLIPLDIPEGKKKK